MFILNDARIANYFDDFRRGFTRMYSKYFRIPNETGAAVWDIWEFRFHLDSYDNSQYIPKSAKVAHPMRVYTFYEIIPIGHVCIGPYGSTIYKSLLNWI